MERVGWIDFLRGMAMILILVFHTEAYYKEYDVTPYYIYTTNAIILFYFISGYLFYRQSTFNLSHKLKSIVRNMLIPYFIFTSFIAVPKVLVRGNNLDLSVILIQIVSGRASWFIAALIVAEAAFFILLWISRGKQIWLSTATIICFITYYLIPFNQHNYWQWQDALIAIVFLYLGYLYHHYKESFHTIHKPLYSSLLLSILIFIKIYEYHVDLPMRNIAIENVPLFLADCIAWLLLIISIIKYIPSCRLIEWTGRHCIVYYFLCGGVPLVTSMLLHQIHFGYEGHFYRFLIVLLLVYLLSTILTALIYRYVPLITKRMEK